MRKMWILPLTVALAAPGLTACDRTDDAEDGGIPKGNLISQFEPTAGTVPFPFDGLFSGFSDPTLNIPQEAPPAQAANQTDGWSTTASIFTDFIGFVDFDTTAEGLRVIALPAGGAPQVLTEGVDYQVSDYPATGTIPGTEVVAPINSFRTRLLIEPLKPLQGSTRHLVVITDALRDTSGNPAVASTQWQVVRRSQPVSEQDDLYVQGLSPQAVATLESLQQQIVAPTLEGVTAITGLSRERIVLAWPFTTQSIGESLGRLAERAPARAAADAAQPLQILAGPSGLTLANIGAPNLADIFVGAVDLPYYLEAPGDGNADAVVNQTFWAADPAQPNLGTQENPTTFLGQVPCGAFAAGAMGLSPSTSTTRCFPVPVERGTERAPLLLTVPNQVAKPEAGWPIVIFQHGITSDRSALLALAPALSSAGFVTVAMDLPLHGIPPADCSAEGADALCGARQQLRGANALFGARERTFDVDLDGQPGPDSSGANFINLPSLLTSRDNNRQAVADLLHLRALTTRLDLNSDGTPDIDAARVYFVGHSLGGITGSTFVALDEQVRAATLANPGGGIGKLLDASRSFGPVIAQGLAANGVVEGTDDYETFLRFAQHLIDPGDPINYAQQLSDRRIHFIEVVGDLVVPNTAPRNPPQGEEGNDPRLDRVTIAGPLSGSTPLIEQIGLEVAVIDDLDAPADVRLGADAATAVRFTSGDHSSVLVPATDPVTQEMQRQIVNFLASDGQCLPLRGSCQ